MSSARDITVPNTYPVELHPVDIARWKDGGTGIDWLHSFESGRPGPHVMVVALVHGNELCGAAALDLLLGEGVRPRAGRLSFCFANVAAYRRFDAGEPTATRYVDEDMNRVWDAAVLDGPRDSLELRRARELRPVLDGVDLLLDIHSMQHAAAALVLAGRCAKGRALAAGTGYPEWVIADFGHASGRRLRDYGRFDDPASPAAAMLVECGQHWAAETTRVAVETACRFLVRTGAVARETLARHLPDAPPRPQRFVEVTEAVTIEHEPFTFAGDYRGLEVIPRKGTPIGRDGPKEVRTPYDDCVLVMPSQRLRKGLTAVRLGRLTDRRDG